MSDKNKNFYMNQVILGSLTVQQDNTKLTKIINCIKAY